MHKVIINTQERAISTDVNRLQLLMGRDIAEIYRFLFDNDGNEDIDAGSIMASHTTTELPLRGEIANGLLVRPQLGSLALLVDQGCALLVSPDNAPDESSYKIILDPGLTLAAPLAMDPNASVDTRVDVIECRVGPPWEFFDSRDIYNPVTSLFQAASVLKERAHRLEYRVRRGVPGDGFPGVQTGWLPLMVASVPAGAITNNDMTFWDVRPLLSDRARQPFALTESFPAGPRLDGMINFKTGGGNAGTLNGVAEAILNGRRVGGTLRRGSVGSDANAYVDLAEVANQQNGGFVWSGGSQSAHIYLACPFGLPRWSRYTDSTSGSRAPRSPRGIPILSGIWPDEAGKPITPISFPTALGLGPASTQDAVAISLSRLSSPGSGYSTTQTFCSGRKRNFGDFMGVFVPCVAVSGAIKKFTFTPGTHFPRNARKLFASVYWTVTVPNDGFVLNIMIARVFKGAYGSTDDNVQIGQFGATLSNAYASPSPFAFQTTIEVPIPVQLPGVTTSFDVALTIVGGESFQTDPSIVISAFEY